jgi:(2Fe-2S) ferredoxin
MTKTLPTISDIQKVCSAKDHCQAQNVFNKCGLNKCHRHIFLCVDCEREGCCNKEQMNKTWKALKKDLLDHNLTIPVGPVHRSRVRCFGICKSHSGPIAVIYPEGIWYHSVDERVAKRIVKEHILQGNIIQEFLLQKEPDKEVA